MKSLGTKRILQLAALVGVLVFLCGSTAGAEREL